MHDPRWKTIIHLHTNHSPDSDLRLEDLARHAHRERVDCVAITDHDTIEGALRFRDALDIRVVVGEEITTSQGHLIGLFLEHRVPPGLPARHTAELIREQGGVVLLPHPFNRFLSCGMGETAIELLDLIDAVEVCNAQNLFAWPDRAAARFARVHGLAGYAGADSHRSSSIGPCWQMMRPFEDAAGFRAALPGAELRRGRHPLPYFMSMGMQFARYLAGARMARGVGINSATMPAGRGSRRSSDRALVHSSR